MFLLMILPEKKGIASWKLTRGTLTCPDISAANNIALLALRQDFTSWLRIIAETWNDLLDPFWPIDLHVVRPTPPATATQRQRRLQVIVVQRVPHDGVSNLFTIVTTGPTERPVRHYARFAPLLFKTPSNCVCWSCGSLLSGAFFTAVHGLAW